MTDTATLQSLDEQTWKFLRRMIADLSDEQVVTNAPTIDARSIAGVVMHAYSSPFYMAFALAGKSRPEMPAEPPATAAELLTRLDTMHDQVKEVLADLPEDALEKMYTMPWGAQWAGREAIAAALSHAVFHAGAIQGMRALAGFPTAA